MMVAEYTTSPWYWTGVAALVPQVSVTFAASYIRALTLFSDLSHLHVVGNIQKPIL
jgi:hypothetical protein